ncbi:MAG: hypothetical protein COV47_05345 [Candidatus Diapherotrites archaeon CG11_big_fil_rev_8_21_14_0_20_37_9]|nr:MAG: hypothetical protein COV47_05345 [Candidatus Diapherotrites archaeon CG11_big_fil_rev_8_21_14_0_20_37_9]
MFNATELYEKIWAIDKADDRKGTWWWWFWLFFIDNPEKPQEPHQLMILWSTKNEKSIKCNGSTFTFPNKILIDEKKTSFDGVVAAWYFDGKMHDSYLLEQSKISLTKKPYSLVSDSENKSKFFEKNGKLFVEINRGEKTFNFELAIDSSKDFLNPTHAGGTYPGGLSFSALGIPKADFSGSIIEHEELREIKGTAYFQYVIVNAPSPSWYWGIFHFPKGGFLSYFNPHIGPALLKGNLTNKFIRQGNISIGNDLYFANPKTGTKESFKLKKITSKKNSKGFPIFFVFGENKFKKISFEVDCYSDAFWEFEKKAFGLLNTKLRYNEYPSKIKNFKVTDKKEKIIVSTKELGEAVGNAEHSWGILI